MKIKAHLIFTQFQNYYSVQIENLENLSVQQIQEFEYFVKIRNGIFDFNKYIFFIQKNIEFYQFKKLIQNLNINAVCDENIIVNKQPKISFGQYKGMQYSDLPDSYLVWLESNYKGKDNQIIYKELKKRRLI